MSEDDREPPERATLLRWTGTDGHVSPEVAKAIDEAWRDLSAGLTPPAPWCEDAHRAIRHHVGIDIYESRTIQTPQDGGNREEP